MTDESVDAPIGPEHNSGSEEDGPDGVEVRVVDKRWWARERGETTSEPRSSKPSYLQELERQLANKDGLLTSYAAKYKEATAEFEEARVRLRREIAKDIDREKRRVLATFLDVIDNLDRAVEAARDTSANSALFKGVEMVRQQFLGTLEEHDVSRIDPVGEAFDPTQHDAVSTVAVDAATQHDAVVDVVKQGYRVGDEILRPASVVVGKHEEAD